MATLAAGTASAQPACPRGAEASGCLLVPAFKFTSGVKPVGTIIGNAGGSGFTIQISRQTLTCKGGAQAGKSWQIFAGTATVTTQPSVGGSATFFGQQYDGRATYSGSVQFGAGSAVVTAQFTELDQFGATVCTVDQVDQVFGRLDSCDDPTATGSAPTTPDPSCVDEADDIDWTMPARLSESDAGAWKKDFEGLPAARDVNPTSWRANLFPTQDGQPYTCNADIRFRWVITKPKGASFVGGAPAPSCKATFRVNRLGTYPTTGVEQQLRSGRWADTGRSFKKNIKVRDFLILGMGDSNGSGEGNAPFYHPRCNRSITSYQFQTAMFLEEQDPRSSVTFLFSACSGAGVEHLVTNRYRGVRKGPGMFDPQIQQLSFLLSQHRRMPVRKVDAAMISVGVNNLAFGPIMGFCVTHPVVADIKVGNKVPCETRHVKPADMDGGHFNAFEESSAGAVLSTWLARYQRELPGRYPALAKALAKPISVRGGLNLKGNRVFMAQYPDFGHDDAGVFCDTRSTDMAANFPPSTFQFLSLNGTKLNATVRKVSKTFGWTAVPTDPEFNAHGYCAVDSYFLGLFDALSYFDIAGPFHPTAPGHAIEFRKTRELLCRRLLGNTTCHS